MGLLFDVFLVNNKNAKMYKKQLVPSPFLTQTGNVRRGRGGRVTAGGRVSPSPSKRSRALGTADSWVTLGLNPWLVG